MILQKRRDQMRRASLKYYYENRTKILKGNKLKDKLNFCSCGCNNETRGKWSTGRNLKGNPRPENLREYINGKKGKDHPNWKGGKKFDKSGYVQILTFLSID